MTGGTPQDTRNDAIEDLEIIGSPEAQAAMFGALAKLQSQMPPIRKGNTGKVEKNGVLQYEYKYADLADVSEVLLPLLGEHGFAFIAPPVTRRGRFGLRPMLTHESGAAISGFYPLPDSSSTPPQSVGSAITYGRRYSLCAITGAAPEGDDDDAAAAQRNHQQSAGAMFDGASPNRPQGQQGQQGQQWRPRPERSGSPGKPGSSAHGEGQEPADGEARWVQDFMARLAVARQDDIRGLRIEVARASSTERAISTATAKELFKHINSKANELDGQAA